MRAGSLAERIAKLLTEKPGLDDDEIAQRLRIEPRQTVNQICRHLVEQGMLVRERGTSGKIVNRLTGQEPSPPRRVRREGSSKPAGEKLQTGNQGRPLWTSDIRKTLLVIPCSSAKQNVTGVRGKGKSILASLPRDLARELAEARQRVREGAAVDETTLIPARHRYCGALYSCGGEALDNLAEEGGHIIILSGGYGAVLASEPIGMYDAPLKPTSWPNRIVERSLMAYAQRRGIASVRAFASATSPYRRILSCVPWYDIGINDAMLLSPQPEPGGMRRSPASLGQAITALRDRTLSTDWRSSYGLRLQVYSS